jgi:hypothetical protein
MSDQIKNLTTADREEYDRAIRRLAILAEASTRDPLPEDFENSCNSLSISELGRTPPSFAVTR